MQKFIQPLLLALGVQLVGSLAAAAQTTNYTKLAVMKADYDHRAALYLGGTRTMAQSALGSPNSVTTQTAETMGKPMEVWSYNASKLYFVDNVLVSYSLNDATLAVGQTFSTALRVGDPMPTRQVYVPGRSAAPKGKAGARVPDDGNGHYEDRDYFPGYSIRYSSGSSRNLSYSVYCYSQLVNGSTPLEGFSEVLFDSNKVITNIYVRQ